MSEINLEFITAFDDINLEIAANKILRADHASNSKRGDVCVYYKSSLSLRSINVNYLNECLLFEVLIVRKFPV